MTDSASVLMQKQSVVKNLSDSGDAHTVTALYLVYKTIAANSRITVGRLKKLLQQDYFLVDKDIDAALAGLVSPSLFNVVSRWKNPKRGIEDTVLTAKPNEEFEAWLETTVDEYPELKIIQPPIFVYRKSEGGDD